MGAPGSPSIKDVDNKDIVTEEDDKKFVQGGSYADYFAKKMAEMKSKGKLSSVPAVWTTATTSSSKNDDDADVQRIGFACDSSEADKKESVDSQEEPIKKKKKSKKSKRDEEQNVAHEETPESSQVPESEDRKKKK